MSTAHLDALIEDLKLAFDGDRGQRGRRVAELLAGYSARHDDWREFAFFSDDHYTRNLVVRTDAFEVLLLGWGAGQESPIHNHEGQDCWMAVLDGTIEELRYAFPEGGHSGPPPVREACEFEAGRVAFIRDEMGLHLVRPARGRAAVSMHLYAAPYDSCNVYCPETGKITRKRLVNDTERGRWLTRA